MAGRKSAVRGSHRDCSRFMLCWTIKTRSDVRSSGRITATIPRIHIMDNSNCQTISIPNSICIAKDQTTGSTSTSKIILLTCPGCGSLRGAQSSWRQRRCAATTQTARQQPNRCHHFPDIQPQKPLIPRPPAQRLRRWK